MGGNGEKDEDKEEEEGSSSTFVHRGRKARGHVYSSLGPTGPMQNKIKYVLYKTFHKKRLDVFESMSRGGDATTSGNFADSEGKNTQEDLNLYSHDQFMNTFYLNQARGLRGKPQGRERMTRRLGGLTF